MGASESSGRIMGIRVRFFHWIYAYVLFAVAVAVLPAVAAEVAIRVPQQSPTHDLGDGVVIADELVDLDVQDDGAILLAVSHRMLYVMNLPGLDVSARMKIRGRAVNVGLLRDSTRDRIRFFVVSRYGRDVNTYFYEYVPGGKFKRFNRDLASFYRNLHGNLVRQSLGSGRPFEAKLFHAAVSGRKVRSVGVWDLPKHTRLYAFVYGEMIAGGGPEVARIEPESRHLVLYTRENEDWTAVWESEESYGGSLEAIRGRDRGEGMEQSEERIQGMIPIDLDDDGLLEVLLVQNRSAPMMQQKNGRKYDRSQVTALDFRGGRAVMVWETEQLKGTIPNIVRWNDQWILPLVEPSGKRTRIFINRLHP